MIRFSRWEIDPRTPKDRGKRWAVRTGLILLRMDGAEPQGGRANWAAGRSRETGRQSDPRGEQAVVSMGVIRGV